MPVQLLLSLSACCTGSAAASLQVAADGGTTVLVHSQHMPRML
jgi:hypothetical protein